MRVKSLPWASPDLAKAALRHWPKGYQGTVRTITIGENATYEVRAPKGRFALRLYRPHRWPTPAVSVEHDFMKFLGATCGVLPPVAHASQATLATLENGFHAALFPWVPGRFVGRPGPKPMRHVGVVLGKMHKAAEKFQWDPQAGRARWNPKTLIQDASVLLQRNWSRYVSQKPLPDFSEGKKAGLSLWKKLDLKSGMCHADLHWGNLKIQGPHVLPFDFDDCGEAPFAYDLAIPQYAITRLQRNPLWEEACLDALLEGYASSGAEPISKAAVHLMVWARFYFILSWILERPEIFPGDLHEQRLLAVTESLRKQERFLFESSA